MKRLGNIIKLTATILFGCSNENQNINGHWHCLTPELGNFKTLDIDDSITTMDKYEIDVSLPNTGLRKDPKTKKMYLPFQENHFVDSYSIFNDTLKITYKDFSYKYVKSNVEKCKLSHRYYNSVINISLPESPIAQDYDNILYCGNLFIGRSIKQGFRDPTKDYPDSVFILANDIFINLKDIPRYCALEKDLASSGEGIKLVLHADSSVSDSFIRRILEKTPQTFTIYRAVKSNGQLGISRIDRD